MYMTVLKMNRNSILSAENLLDINSPNSIHKWLTQQQDCHRAEGKILYKIINQKDDIFMYIQSKDKFNLSNIDKSGFIYVKDFEIADITTGQYYFDIETFPNTTINNRSHMYIQDINQRYLWLQKQFQKYNIELVECVEYKKDNLILDKDKIKKIYTSKFRGTIYIHDENQAKILLEQGLGRFKNYGLGLCLIKNF